MARWNVTGRGAGGPGGPPGGGAFVPGRLAIVLLSAVFTWSCGEQGPDPWSRVDAFGEPRHGLTPEEVARFEAGRTLFDRVYAPEEGVGPLFNEDQCSACHTDPAAGGTGEQVVRKAARFHGDDGSCDLLERAGGENLRSRVTAAASALGMTRDSVPDGATHVGAFDVPFLFGLGAVEAVSDSLLMSLSDPDDRDGDGISGRVGRTADGRVGRFGKKADVATLRDFTVSALLNEMGLTTRSRPEERGRNGTALPPGADPSSDPEVPDEAVGLITDFVRFLGVAPSAIPRDSTLWLQGREEFGAVGCSSCHLPRLPVGPGREGAPLFSDFLLHDLGTALGGGPCTGVASPDEFRTAPLAGLAANRTYLHDGRARSLEEAIGLHGGEASGVRAAFDALDPIRRAALLAYLETL